MYNPFSETAYWHLDDFFMFLAGQDPNSWKDSIGRNFRAFVAWGDLRLLDAIKRCFLSQTSANFQRHPHHHTGELSRDHLSYALIAFLYAGKKAWFFEVADKLKWQFNHRHSLRGMYLWIKSFYGVGWRTLFYAVKIPEMLLMVLINWAVRKWANVKPERSQDDWDLDITRVRTNKQKKAFYMCVPAYVLHIFAWQLYVMPDTFFNRLLKRITLPLAGQHNYLIRHLLGADVNIYKVSRYKSMTGSRWTTTLDELNNRHVEIMTWQDISENNLDRAYLHGLFLKVRPQFLKQ